MTPELATIIAAVAGVAIVIALGLSWWINREPTVSRDTSGTIPLFGSELNEPGQAWGGDRDGLAGSQTIPRPASSTPSSTRTQEPSGWAGSAQAHRGNTETTAAGAAPRPMPPIPKVHERTDTAGESAVETAAAAQPSPTVRTFTTTRRQAPIDDPDRFAPPPKPSDTPIASPALTLDAPIASPALPLDAPIASPALTSDTPIASPAVPSEIALPAKPSVTPLAAPTITPPAAPDSAVVAHGVPGTMIEGQLLRFSVPAEGTLQFLPGRLEIANGMDRGREFRFVHVPGPNGTEVTFGRSEGELYRHIQLRHQTVSRSHARMRLDDGNWCLLNLSNTNPVVYNGRVLSNGEEQRLSDGDRIEMGEVLFTFRSR